MWKSVAAAIVAMSASAVAGEPTPLFSDDAPIEILLSAPWKAVARAAPDDAPIDGVLRHDGVDFQVLVSTRGKSRRRKEVCAFPPLRIEFKEKQPEGSLFHKQKKLKFVSYCRKAESHQQLVLTEYAAYRLYNAATPESFRVRLADVSYVDAATGEAEIRRMGFFIEDADDLARRIDLEEVKRGRTPVSMFRPDAAARVAVFQYMIGNLDWELTAGPEGEDCCHNGKILGAAENAEAGLVSVPYDFDMSGLVDAPYAAPPEQFRIRSVTSRVFRGFCAHNDETRAAAREFAAAPPAYENALSATPGLSDKSKKKSLKFLAGFFDAVGDDAAVEKNLIGKCRG